MTEDLTGKKFGRLTVVRRSSGSGRTRWICLCDCGKTKSVLTYNLRSGDIQSCGCLNSENASKRANKNLKKAREKVREKNFQNDTSVMHLKSEKPKSSNQTGYRGVTFLEKRNNYLATICFRNKHYHLGYFYDPLEAHKAYLAAKSILHEPYINDGTITEIEPHELREMIRK